ncbi:MAG: ABC transporter permease [Candidatus Atribacteria bacterium]|nr:ABC transporter permease [Candidatus Atribacteria bacterium]
MRKIKWNNVFKKNIITGPVIILFFMVVLFAIFIESFFEISNISNIFRQSCMLALVSIGQTIAILMGGIDLSQGSVMGLVSVSAALIMANGVPIIPGIIMGLLIGLVCGLINGWFIAYIKIPPFVATFGMFGMALGLGLVITQERVVWGFPETVRVIHDGELVGIPAPIIIVVVFYLLFYYLMHYTTYGTGLFAIGGKEDAAELSGIPTRFYKMLGYGISGIMAGAAGLMMMARMNSAQAIIGSGYEFEAIAATVLGGTVMSGGKEGKTLIGVLIIGILRNGLNLMGVNVYLQLVAIGSIIILAYIFEYLNYQRLSEEINEKF